MSKKGIFACMLVLLVAGGLYIATNVRHNRPEDFYMRGIVGAIDIHRNGEVVNVTVFFENEEVHRITTTQERITHLWLPALKGANVLNSMETENIEIVNNFDNDTTYLKPLWSVRNPEGSVAIFTKKQIKSLIKALR